MCKILAWLSIGENWKDYIIPILGPILGVIGAYLIMLKQIARQRNLHDLDISEDQSLFRSVYELNLTILSDRVKKVLSPLQDHRKRILEEKLDFHVNISEITINTFEILDQIDYIRLYESYRPIFISSKNKLFSDFVNSYDNFKRLSYIIPAVNRELQSFSVYKDEIEIRIVRNQSELMDILKINYASEKSQYRNLESLLHTHYQDPSKADTIEGYNLFTNEAFSSPELHRDLDEHLLSIIKIIKDNRVLLHNLSNKLTLLNSFLENACTEIPNLLETIQDFLTNIRRHYESMNNEKVTYI